MQDPYFPEKIKTIKSRLKGDSSRGSRYFCETKSDAEVLFFLFICNLFKLDYTSSTPIYQHNSYTTKNSQHANQCRLEIKSKFKSPIAKGKLI